MSAVEDVAATILRFADGAIATIMLSDTAVRPRSWDLTSGENLASRRTPNSSAEQKGPLHCLDLTSGRCPFAKGWDQPACEAVSRGCAS